MQSAPDRPETIPTPFPHLLWRRFLSPQTAADAAKWLAGIDAWHEDRLATRRIRAINLADVRIPEGLLDIVKAEFLGALRRILVGDLGTPLADQVEVEAHCMEPGCWIGLHNDAGTNESRVAMSLQPPNQRLSGGSFLLYRKPGSEPERVYAATHNQAIAFATGTRSHHAVGKVDSGTRFSLVYRFERLE